MGSRLYRSENPRPAGSHQVWGEEPVHRQPAVVRAGPWPRKGRGSQPAPEPKTAQSAGLWDAERPLHVREPTAGRLGAVWDPRRVRRTRADPAGPGGPGTPLPRRRAEPHSPQQRRIPAGHLAHEPRNQLGIVVVGKVAAAGKIDPPGAGQRVVEPPAARVPGDGAVMRAPGDHRGHAHIRPPVAHPSRPLEVAPRAVHGAVGGAADEGHPRRRGDPLGMGGDLPEGEPATEGTGHEPAGQARARGARRSGSGRTAGGSAPAARRSASPGRGRGPRRPRHGPEPRA